MARVNPKAASPDRVKVVTGEHSELRVGLTGDYEKKLQRVRELTKGDLEETMQKLLDCYLERHCPLEKAKLVVQKKARPKGCFLRPKTQVRRRPIPSGIKHQVMLRDQGQCTFVHPPHGRCSSRRYLDFHHKRPVAQGGGDSVGNLVLLCSGHHQAWHVGRLASRLGERGGVIATDWTNG